jgi:hypothetical protein
MRRRRFVVPALVAGGLTLMGAITAGGIWGTGAASAAAGSPAVHAGAPPATGSSSELEMDISGNGSNMTMGEPEIAVNPANPNQMYVDGATFPVPLVLNGQSPVPDTCGGWASGNGGLSWQPSPFPQPICEDGEAVFGPDGTLYTGGDVATSTNVVPCSTPGIIKVGPACVLIHGFDPIFRSTDGGHTWSAPVHVMGSTSLGPFPFAQGSGTPIDTFDRPWISVDQSTNTVYAIGHNIADHEAFVTASTDEAHSFGPIYAVDSPDYPSAGLSGGTFSAANGVLAVSYVAAKAPGASCPCTIFETSTDHGATFTRHIIPTVNPAAQPDPFTAADPSASGHFAVTILDATGMQNQVYTTDDSGATWHGPAVVAAPQSGQVFKPWITFGPHGVIALAWRIFTGAPNTSPYLVWAAVGRDEGHNGPVFSAPMQVSSEPGAYPAQYQGGDDFSFITLNGDTVRVGWGDSRDVAVGAGVQIWMARIPLQSFRIAG